MSETEAGLSPFWPEPKEEEHRYASYLEPESIRRQCKLCVGLVAMMAIAAFACGFLLPTTGKGTAGVSPAFGDDMPRTRAPVRAEAG